jgi:hypothetical protein
MTESNIDLPMLGSGEAVRARMGLPPVGSPPLAGRIWPSRGESLAMFAVTATYLLFEVAFAARLLDVVGSTTDLAEIERIEMSGRVISGIALTLVVWSWLVLPRLRSRPADTRYRNWLAGVWLSLSAAACVALMYLLQEGILELITQRSDAPQRQAAAVLTLVSASSQSGLVELDGLDLTSIDRDAPELKAFYALLPALALSVSDLETKTAQSLRQLLTYQVEDRIGSFETFFNQSYLPAQNLIKDSWNGYLEISDAYAKALQQLRENQDTAYRQYRQGLGRYTPTTLPSRAYPNLRRQLQQSGVPVPWDWHPTDRDGFYNAIARDTLARIDPPYFRAMQSAFGTRLPHDLTAATFFAHPAVQEVWRNGLAITHPIPLDIDLTPDQVHSQIYQPWIDAVVAEEHLRYVAPVSDFEKNGPWYDQGNHAVRVAFIPMIALSFSLVGAAVHSFKTAKFGLQFFWGMESAKARQRVNWTKGTVALICLLMTVFYSTRDNAITRAPLFVALEEQTAAKATPLMATALRLIIQAEGAIYPIADQIRHDLLQGLTFDFDPRSDGPMFERRSDL